MRGRVWPRPYQLVDGERRPIKGKSTWTFEIALRGDDGRRRFVTKGGFATKGDAQRALTAALSDQVERPGIPTKPSAMPLGDFIRAEWLPALHHLKSTTVENYSELARAYVAPHIGGVRLCDLTPGRIAALYGVLRERGGRGGRPLSASTVHHVHVVLVRVLGYAVDTGALRTNPVTALPSDHRPRSPKTEPRHWAPLQAAAFVDATRQDRLHALYVVALNVGLRRGELAGLQWGDVDLDAATLTVTHNRTTRGYEVVESTPKTRQGRRTVELDPGVVDVLRTHRKRQLEERMAWGEAWAGEDHVFSREDGSALHPQTIAWHLQEAATAAGVPWIGVHGLRHTCGVLLLAAGVPLKVVSERLGHTSTTFTADLYQHVVPGMQRSASEQLSKMLGLG